MGLLIWYKGRLHSYLDEIDRRDWVEIHAVIGFDESRGVLSVSRNPSAFYDRSTASARSAWPSLGRNPTAYYHVIWIMQNPCFPIPPTPVLTDAKGDQVGSGGGIDRSRQVRIVTHRPVTDHRQGNRPDRAGFDPVAQLGVSSMDDVRGQASLRERQNADPVRSPRLVCGFDRFGSVRVRQSSKEKRASSVYPLRYVPVPLPTTASSSTGGRTTGRTATTPCT